MTRRLSFDAHPKELAHCDSGPTHVSFFWRYEHPYAYVDARGRRVALFPA
jgi:hypothetical protein